MNILYLNANQRNRLSDTAGYATHMAKTIKGFEVAGHRVIKLLAGEAQEAEQAKRAYRKLNSFFPRNASRSVRDLYEVLHDYKLYRKWHRLAAERRIDFVYERMNQLHVSGLRIARRLGVPFVIEINDPMRETLTVDLTGPFKRYAILLEDHLVRESDFVVLGSAELKKSYARRGIRAEKLLVLYPTADLDMFRPSLGTEQISQQLGLKDKVVVGLVAGNMSAGWRRTDLFLEVLQELAQENTNVGALVVGYGNPTLSPGPGQSSIIFTGKIPYSRIPQYLNAMDICVIPNATWYGSPTKLFEYGAVGKPVVASKFPPIQEIIEHGRSGLLFAPNDKEDMIRQIRLLLQNQSLREQLGRNLRDKITTLYTWEKNTAAVIEAIERLQTHGPSKLTAKVNMASFTERVDRPT
jgi:glycosyltransferase involved in cell wall biosynthesis